MSGPDPTNNEIVMYSSSLCGFCAMAKRLLSEKDVPFEIRSVDGDPEMRAQMIERSGRTSVPQIFIGDTHVGGCDELYALERSGKLDALLHGVKT